MAPVRTNFTLFFMIFKEIMLHLDKYKMCYYLFFIIIIIEPDSNFLGHCIIPILWIQLFIKAEMVKLFVQTFDNNYISLRKKSKVP